MEAAAQTVSDPKHDAAVSPSSPKGKTRSACSPDVDLVIIFRSAPFHASRWTSKKDIRENAEHAEADYTRLLQVLHRSGLQATGKRGQRNGQLLVFVWTPPQKLAKLVQRERYTDFLRGLPSTDLLSHHDSSVLADPSTLAPADRLRIIYEYITSTRRDGGLGVVPKSKDWKRIESIFVLHNREFNATWLRTWTLRQFGFGIGNSELDKIKAQFGEAVALYFAFLSTYTHSLIYISALGVVCYWLQMPYSIIYSSLLFLWSVSFVEYWRIRERSLSIRWGTRGSLKAEHRRPQYEDLTARNGFEFSWWKRDLRILASLPIILFFAVILAAILTIIFIFEAFVTTLYTGPGRFFISFSPTLLFTALVPQLLEIYHHYAALLTDWEVHAYQSLYDFSLTLKTFALSAIVAYLGLALHAFVYVPFGETLMGIVSHMLFATSAAFEARATRAVDYISTTTVSGMVGQASQVPQPRLNMWATGAKINPSSLQDQMFAYTVTNQVSGSFSEICLPFIMRKINGWWNGRQFGSYSSSGSLSSSTGSSGGNVISSSMSKKTGKRVGFEDEETCEKEDREFLERVRHEVALPEYTLFADYSEMVTQFGYVALWSTIWPLAPVVSLLNNWLESRGDALKITTYSRRPIPCRTDTIGPWLDTLSFLAWLSALTNTALVYLFRPLSVPTTTAGSTVPDSTAASNSTVFPGPIVSSSPGVDPSSFPSASLHTTLPRIFSFSALSASSPSSFLRATQRHAHLFLPALLLSLSASHVHILVRVVVRHVLERAVWKGSAARLAEKEAERKIKSWYLKSLKVDDVGSANTSGSGGIGMDMGTPTSAGGRTSSSGSAGCYLNVPVLHGYGVGQRQQEEGGETPLTPTIAAASAFASFNSVSGVISRSASGTGSIISDGEGEAVALPSASNNGHDAERDGTDVMMGFWGRDEGLHEIRRCVKDL